MSYFFTEGMQFYIQGNLSQFFGSVSSKLKSDKHIISFPEKQCAQPTDNASNKFRYCKIVVDKNSQGLINWLQTCYNGGEGVAMIADCISVPREATNMKKPYM